MPAVRKRGNKGRSLTALPNVVEDLVLEPGMLETKSSTTLGNAVSDLPLFPLFLTAGIFIKQAHSNGFVH